MIVGYTTGVFDLFHIGHLNLLRNAKERCDKLIVGVTTDELVSYKGKRAVIPFQERLEIIKSLKYVDEVVPQTDMDKFEAWNRLNFDIMFVGDDWKGTPQWKEIEKKFSSTNVKIIYLPYTKETSSTLLREVLQSIISVDKTLFKRTGSE